MPACDIMTRNVVTVGADTPVQSVAALLVEHRISGLPVVDAENRIVGIVSEGDLCRRVELGTERRRGRWLEFLTDESELAFDYVRAHGHTAADVMTTIVVQVAPDTLISEVADLFEARRIKRVPVVEQGKLVGIVSRSNLVQAIAAFRPPAAPTDASDRTIRENVLKEYAHRPWRLQSGSNVVVHDGVMHPWGVVDTEEERAALRAAAKSVAGVKAVENHTILGGNDWYARLRHAQQEEAASTTDKPRS
jgi:CBS domain-containing protein